MLLTPELSSALRSHPRAPSDGGYQEEQWFSHGPDRAVSRRTLTRVPLILVCGTRPVCNLVRATREDRAHRSPRPFSGDPETPRSEDAVRENSRTG